MERLLDCSSSPHLLQKPTLDSCLLSQWALWAAGKEAKQFDSHLIECNCWSRRNFMWWNLMLGTHYLSLPLPATLEGIIAIQGHIKWLFGLCSCYVRFRTLLIRIRFDSHAKRWSFVCWVLSGMVARVIQENVCYLIFWKRELWFPEDNNSWQWV